ncbi:TPA: carbamate kinase [Streptococcus suis]|nr:carbamate kinase [Streptococcus suis]
MKKQKIVIALGGNAILSSDASAKAQQEALNATVKSLVELIKAGHDLVITHGNGPQVGNLLLQQEAANSTKNPAMPLDTLVAMTQGSIGFWLETALNNELLEQGIAREIATIMTEVIVEARDPAFKHPTKPIGPFLTEEEAKKEEAATGAQFKEDAGRGWRKVVASPKPIGIREASVIKKLVENGAIVISAGGGGVPVIQDAITGKLTGVEAVIDKDFASRTLSELVDADLFIILTGVDNVYINFNKPNQEKLELVTVSELKTYMEQGQFAIGSMLPKIEAAIGFVESQPGRKAVITSLQNLSEFLVNNKGTQIILD